MIDKLIYTVESFERYHIMLWNNIIARVEKIKCKLSRGLLTKVKRDVYYSLFTPKVTCFCFGCEWMKLKSGRNCCFCLFDIDIEIMCLNGAWEKYKESKTKEDALKYARVIRDFPIDKRWL